MNVLTVKRRRKPPPEFGPVRIRRIQTVIEDFQYKYHAVQPIKSGGFEYERNLCFYAYIRGDKQAYLRTGTVPGLHIQKVESAFPQYEGHNKSKSGKYLNYRLQPEFQEDIFLLSPDELEELEADKEQAPLFYVEDLSGK